MQLKPGTELQNGRYRIIRTLGQGGFGITYEAEQVALHRKVAIKEFFMKEYCERNESTSHVTLGATEGSKNLVARFRDKFFKEALMIAGLDHPNIVKIHDVFEENGTAYYSMEYIIGGSLKELIARQGKLSEGLALKYMTEVGEALQYVHDKKILHFDIKPSNIMLRESGTAALIDFGVSKHFDEGGRVTSSTPVGISKGYAPLEQYRQEEISIFKPATDIYAFGATLYSLVTGLTPPDAHDVYEEGEIHLPENLSENMKRVIAALTQPRQKDRPQNMRAVLPMLAGVPDAGPGDENEHQPEGEGDEVTIIGVDNPNQSNPVIRKSATGSSNGHEWVDLGLPSGLKWATCNVGASKPEDYGSYFAWGETKHKNEYRWKSYAFQIKTNWAGEIDKLSKYVSLRRYGQVDNKISLCPEDDAARVNWGSTWRMPTDADMTELITKCEWTWTSMGGKKGYKVTGKNGNSIFLPAGGERLGNSIYNSDSYGYYWSASLNSNGPHSAFRLYCHSVGVGVSDYDRCYGFSIRPVTE